MNDFLVLSEMLAFDWKESSEKSFNMLHLVCAQFSCASESMSVEPRRLAIAPRR